jgi:hypothetical protein
VDLIATLRTFDDFQGHHRRACAVALVDVVVAWDVVSTTTRMVVSCPRCGQAVSGSVHDTDMPQGLLRTVRTATGEVDVALVVDPEALTPAERDRHMALHERADSLTLAEDLVRHELTRLLLIDDVVPVAQRCRAGLADVSDRVLLDARRARLAPQYAQRHLAFQQREAAGAVADDPADARFTALALQVFEGIPRRSVLEELAEMRDLRRARIRRLDAEAQLVIPTTVDTRLPTPYTSASAEQPEETAEDRRALIDDCRTRWSNEAGFPVTFDDVVTATGKTRRTIEKWRAQGSAYSKKGDREIHRTLTSPWATVQNLVKPSSKRS